VAQTQKNRKQKSAMASSVLYRKFKIIINEPAQGKKMEKTEESQIMPIQNVIELRVEGYKRQSTGEQGNTIIG